MIGTRDTSLVTDMKIRAIVHTIVCAATLMIVWDTSITNRTGGARGATFSGWTRGHSITEPIGVVTLNQATLAVKTGGRWVRTIGAQSTRR